MQVEAAIPTLDPNPLIASLQRNPARPVRTANDEESLTHDVALIDDESHIMTDANNNIIRTTITETYIYHKKHREQYEPGNGRWSASMVQERASFQNCRFNGGFKKWKGATCKGWGLVLDGITPMVLGQGVDQFGNMSDVKVCKFVEGTVQSWHGYPINYRSLNEEPIGDNALNYWKDTLHIIDKSDLNDIKRKEESPLL